MTRKFTDEKRLEIGKAAHEAADSKEIQALAIKHDAHISNVYDMRRQYRKSIGIPIPPPRGAEKRRQKKQASTRAIVVDMRVSDAGTQIIRLEQENKALVEQLAHAHEEVDTLQKLLMTVGRTL